MTTIYLILTYLLPFNQVISNATPTVQRTDLVKQLQRPSARPLNVINPLDITSSILLHNSTISITRSVRNFQISDGEPKATAVYPPSRDSRNQRNTYVNLEAPTISKGDRRRAKGVMFS